MRRYYVQCKACGTKTGTKPTALDPIGSKGPKEVDCVICGAKVSRDDGQYMSNLPQKPKPELDLLALE